MPHHHLVMGPVDGSIRCYGRVFDARTFLRRFADCDCLSHAFSREWKEVTGDSWIVHAVPVTGAAGAGAYMAKYLAKEFDAERGKELGMRRRYSTSRGWPGSGKLKLAASDWDLIMCIPGHKTEGEFTNDPALVERVGPPAVKKVFDDWSAERGPREIVRRLRDATYAREANVASSRPVGGG